MDVKGWAMIDGFEWPLHGADFYGDNPFRVRRKENTLEVKFPEELSIRYFDFYYKKIETLHKEMLSKNIANIDIDVSDLVFLNSSGIKMFIDWIYNVLALPSDHRYSITFYINKNIIWQQEGINILADLAPRIIKIVST